MDLSESLNLDKLLGHIEVLRDNSVYRLGDIIFCKGFRWERDRATILSEQEKYFETIAYKYLIENENRQRFNLRLLSSLVDQKIKNNRLTVPDKDELVIHIRAGDLIALGTSAKKKTEDYISLIQKARHRRTINKVTIVTLLHYGNYVERGEWLHTDESEAENKENLRKFFEQIYKQVPGVRLSVLSNTDIDRDLCYLSKAQHLILDTGGFSFLVGLLNPLALLEPKCKWNIVVARIVLYMFPKRRPRHLRRFIGF